MKTFIFCVSIVFTFFFSQASEARDLLYKFGLGYRQMYSNAFVDEQTKAFTDVQLHGLEISYGVAPDLQLGAYFGFLGNFDAVAAGPVVRYDLNRLIDRDAMIWKYLNLFVEAGFYGKFGGDIEAGITGHLPYLGFEIMPFTENNFAILTAAGVVVDLVKENRIGFTQAMFGDVGVRYYF